MLYRSINPACSVSQAICFTVLPAKKPSASEKCAAKTNLAVSSIIYLVRLDIIDGHHFELSPLFKTQTSQKLLYVLRILIGFIKFGCPQGDSNPCLSLERAPSWAA